MAKEGTAEAEEAGGSREKQGVQNLPKITEHMGAGVIAVRK